MSASSHVSLGVQGACPQWAVTHAGETGECCAIGTGLKLVSILGRNEYFGNLSTSGCENMSKNSHLEFFFNEGLGLSKNFGQLLSFGKRSSMGLGTSPGRLPMLGVTKIFSSTW